MLALLMAAGLLATAPVPHRPVAELQALLDRVYSDDEPIVLREGTAFDAPPGTVIFLTREEGMRRMIAVALRNEPELGMLFIPEWSAWVTHTKLRMPEDLKIDSTYAAAAYGAELEAECWHTHPNHGPRVSAAGLRLRLLRSTMPWIGDLHQMYAFERDLGYSTPTARFRGVIAHSYGITEYGRADDLGITWAQAAYPLQGLILEAGRMIDEVQRVESSQLTATAAAHTGMVKLRITRVP